MRAPAALLLLALVVAGVWWTRMMPEFGSDAQEATVPDLAAVRAAFASADRPAIETQLAKLAACKPAPVAWLLAGLRDPDRGVREWSAHALGDLAPPGPEVVDALIVAFEDEDDWVRWKAARALGALRARKALDVLRVAAEADQETEVVRAAAQAAVTAIEGR